MVAKKIIRAVSLDILPYIKWTVKGEDIKYKGIMEVLMDHFIHTLRNRLNLTIHLDIIGENELGYELSPGNWTGPIGTIVRKENDVFFGALTVPELAPYVVMTPPFGDYLFHILSGPPTNTRRNIPSIFSSASTDTWIALSFSWFFAALIYVLLYVIETKMNPSGKGETFDPLDTFLTFYGLLFQRGFENLPKTDARRILVSGWLFVIFFLTIELGGALSSKLAVQAVPERIDRMEDILKYPNIIPYVSRGVSADMAIMTSDNSVFKKVWKRVVEKKGWVSYAESVGSKVNDEVSRGEAIHLGAITIHLRVAVHNACKERRRPFYISKESYGSLPFGGFHRQGLDPTIAEAINLIFITFGGMGFHDLMMRTGTSEADLCLAKDISRITYEETNVNAMSGVFKMLFLGLSTSTIAFAVEMIYYHRLYAIKPRPRNISF